MKTTVDIPDAIYRQLQRRATDEGKPVRSLLTAALRQFLTPSSKKAKRFRLRDCSVDGDGIAPELRGANWETLRDIIYDGRGA